MKDIKGIAIRVGDIICDGFKDDRQDIRQDMQYEVLYVDNHLMVSVAHSQKAKEVTGDKSVVWPFSHPLIINRI